jgi:hypothetical protein
MRRIEIVTPLAVGVILGLSAGIVTGMMAGLAGMAIGLGAGALAGLVVGKAIRRDEELRAARSRELDGIIGVTQGDLGAAPVAMPHAVEPAAHLGWASECLTPPPALAG